MIRFSMIYRFFISCLAFILFSLQHYGQNEYFNKSINIFNADEKIYTTTQKLPDVGRLDIREGVEIKYLDFDSARLYVQIEGKGIPMLLINGGPGSTSHHFHPFFSEIKDNHKIIYYDQRGTGLSSRNQSGGYNLEEAINDIENIRKKLGIGKWYVLGHSYGGLLAQYYAVTYPDALKGLILVCASMPFRNDFTQNGAERLFLTKAERKRISYYFNLMDKNKITEAEGLYNAALNGDWKRQSYYKPTKLYAAQTSKYEWSCDTKFNATMSYFAGRLDLANCFNNFPIPALIIEGQYDLTWDIDKIETIKKYHPNANIRVIKESAHSPFQSNPEDFFKSLTRFTTKHAQDNFDLGAWKIYLKEMMEENSVFKAHQSEYFKNITLKGVEWGVDFYANYKKQFPGKDLFDSRALNNLAIHMVYDKDYDGAIKLLEMNTEAYPNNVLSYYFLAKVYVWKGDKASAEKHIMKYIYLTNKGVDKNYRRLLKKRKKILLNKNFRISGL